MIHLRIRSEHSHRTCYGPVSVVADRLAEVGCKAAGLVDTKGTWGHTSWERELRAREIVPMYGSEFSVPCDGRRPVAWALAEDTRQFYRFSSSYNKEKGAEQFAAAKGIVRFAGAALSDPACFDYVDINPRSVSQAHRSLALAKSTNKPLVLTADNDYPGKEHEGIFLAWDDSRKLTPQHILSKEEMRSAFWFLDDETYAKALSNCHEVFERIGGVKLPKAPMIWAEGSLRDEVEVGRRSRLERGHISDWTSEYQERLERELGLIEDKKFDSYFIIVADLVSWAKERMLVGPARGSSAGSLVCYLLGITEVDPLIHGLLFERFVDVNRADLPDIDIDFSDKRRHLCFEYLAEKWGSDNVARIGSINTLKARSVMAHVGKKMGIPHGAAFPVINVLIEYSSGDSRFGKGLEDTMQNTQPGKDFAEKFPEAMVMGELENHASHTGVHAAGILVSNEPVVEYCTVHDGIAQVDKHGAEYLNLLKIDALGLRTLGVIEDSDVIESANDLYDLTLDDQNVFDIINDAKFSGVFQFEGAAQRRVSAQIPITSFRELDHITALARPGPLGGGAANTYIKRKAGQEPTTFRHPSMELYLGDTMGVVLYQEQVMRIVREIGGFSWEETSVIRKGMSGRKGSEFMNRHLDQFLAGAQENGIPKEVAAEIWNEIYTFGAWGMNKSHTVSYAVISYWCAYMKYHHPVEYAAALMRNAKDDEQVIEMLRELDDEGINYVPFDPDLSEAEWVARDGMLLGGYTNLVGIGPVKAAKYIERRNNGGLTDKDREALAKCKVKYSDLRPAHDLWGHIYDDPASYNINGHVKEFAELKDREDAVVICKVLRVDRRDENETVRVARRGGKRVRGQSLFLDMFVVDDSLSKPVLVRIKRFQWDKYGIALANKAIAGEDWFLVRGTWLKDFSMLTMDKIKCLTNSEIFDAA